MFVRPRRGVLQSAVDFLIPMIAGGNHTIISSRIARPGHPKYPLSFVEAYAGNYRRANSSLPPSRTSVPLSGLV